MAFSLRRAARQDLWVMYSPQGEGLEDASPPRLREKGTGDEGKIRYLLL